MGTPGGIHLDSDEALEQQFGDDIRHIAQKHNTAFKLCKALRSREPPVFVSDAVAKHWLRRYSSRTAQVYVDSACHLEQYYGDILRAQACSNGEEVCKWLLAEHSVSVPVRVCVKCAGASILSMVSTFCGLCLFPIGRGSYRGCRITLPGLTTCWKVTLMFLAAPKKYTTVTIVFMKQEKEPENDHSQL